MSLYLPKARLIHTLNLNDADAVTVGNALSWGTADAFLDEMNRRCTRIEGELEVEDDGRRRKVKVRRTLDAHGNLITEHQTGRQDCVIRTAPITLGGDVRPPT